MAGPSSAHFPKFVLHCRTTFHELRKVMGTSKPMFLVPLSMKSLKPILPRVSQGLQIGGTSDAKPAFSRLLTERRTRGIGVPHERFPRHLLHLRDYSLANRWLR